MTLVTAHQRLEQHREVARLADARREEVRLEHARAQRVANAAEGALSDYFAGLERGEKSDAPKEKVLRAALAKARDAAGVEWDARAQAAAEVAREAEGAVTGFIASNVEALAGELLEEAVAARDRLMAAVDELNAAEGNWNGVRARWSPLMAQRGISPAELPPSPLGGATGAMAEAMAPLASGQPRHPSRLLPIPRSFLPEGERPEPVPEDGVTDRQLPVGEGHLAGLG